MTTTLRSTIRVELGWTWRDQLGGLLFTDSNRLAYREDLADGAGEGQSDAVYHAFDQALAAGQSVELALDALPQAMFGGTITVRLAKVKALLLVNKSAAGHLVLGGAASAQWLGPFGMLGDTLKVGADNPLLAANRGDGWPVEPGANRLRIEAVGGDAVYDLVLLGTSAAGGSSSSSSSLSSSSSSSSSSTGS